MVTEVDPQGPAAQRGIQTGDVILNVGGKAVSNVGDVRSSWRRPNRPARTACCCR